MDHVTHFQLFQKNPLSPRAETAGKYGKAATIAGLSFGFPALIIRVTLNEHQCRWPAAALDEFTKYRPYANMAAAN